MAAYSVWITIKITHGYFITDTNCVTVQPSVPTALLLAKARVIFKQQDYNTWLLLREDGYNDALIMAALIPPLTFCIKNNRADFYYYTNKATEDRNENLKIELVLKNGIWGLLHINAYDAATTDNIVVHIEEATKKMEFIVISRSGKRANLELREESGRLKFEQSEITFPGEPYPVYRFVTVKTIALKEFYTYKLGLWELKGNGELLISSNISLPKPTAASVVETGIISSYFYF